ncbi:MAG: hypothetical protein ACK5O4_00140 [bacterium]
MTGSQLIRWNDGLIPIEEDLSPITERIIALRILDAPSVEEARRIFEGLEIMSSEDPENVPEDDIFFYKTLIIAELADLLLELDASLQRTLDTDYAPDQKGLEILRRFRVSVWNAEAVILDDDENFFKDSEFPLCYGLLERLNTNLDLLTRRGQYSQNLMALGATQTATPQAGS